LENRTVQDFVEDMDSDCKSLKEILMIVLCTRWRDHKQEVREFYRELKKCQKQISNKNRKGRR